MKQDSEKASQTTKPPLEVITDKEFYLSTLNTAAASHPNRLPGRGAQHHFPLLSATRGLAHPQPHHLLSGAQRASAELLFREGPSRTG